MRGLSFEEIVESDNQDTSPARLSRLDMRSRQALSGVSIDDDATAGAADDSAFLLPIITDALTKAAAQLYNATWQPRVARQQNTVGNSTLPFIDYAAPCFDLAKAVRLSPTTIAAELVRHLQSEGVILDGFGIESIVGYINFQVPDELLYEATQRAARWLNSPDGSASRHVTDHYLVVGPVMGQEDELHQTDELCQFVDHVYDLCGGKHNIQYLVGDSSEEAVEYISRLWRSQDTPGEVSRSRRQLRSYLLEAREDGEASGVAGLFATTRANWQAKREKTMQARNIMQYQSVFESDMATAVHAFLDKGIEERQEFISDTTSQATYYKKGDTIFALRSAEGFLYRYAYLFYALEAARSENGTAHRLIVLAPTKISSILQDFLATKTTKDCAEVLYVDPSLLQADILEMHSTMDSLSDHLLELSQILLHLRPQLMGVPSSRRAILALADMPFALNQVFDGLSSPMSVVFELLRSSAQAKAALL
ncbi:MAG TPA: hypothetical protein VLH38_02320 [Patescibacteria group bacterium]|nr:hypothetical protein [Patescibacteria group bacterium]